MIFLSSSRKLLKQFLTMGQEQGHSIRVSWLTLLTWNFYSWQEKSIHFNNVSQANTVNLANVSTLPLAINIWVLTLSWKQTVSPTYPLMSHSIISFTAAKHMLVSLESAAMKYSKFHFTYLYIWNLWSWRQTGSKCVCKWIRINTHLFAGGNT
jgi:hypothetical protein